MRFAFGLWIVGILLFPAAAGAQARLDASGCEGLDAVVMESGLELELEGAADALRDGRTLITLGCADDEVRIEVGDPITDKHVVRVVPMPLVDRERVLTLAIAQLVLTSWLELLLAPQEGPAAEAAETVAREAIAEAEVEHETPSPVVTPPPPPAPTTTTRGELSLDVGPRVRLEGENLPTASAAIRGQLVQNDLVLVGARLGIEWGRAFRDRGSVDVWNASFGVRAGLRAPAIGVFFLDAAIELGVDVLALEGRPNDPSAVTGGTTVAVVADAMIELAPSIRVDSLVVALPLSVGAIVFAPDAPVSGERSVVAGGALFSAALRLAWAPR